MKRMLLAVSCAVLAASFSFAGVVQSPIRVSLVPALGVLERVSGPSLSVGVLPALAPDLRGQLPTLTALSVAAPVVSAPGLSVTALSLGAAEIETAVKQGQTQRMGEIGMSLFDGGRGNGNSFLRPPTGGEDRRINRALKAISNSGVGTAVYQEVYKNYGGNLTFHIDDNKSAVYDARLSFQDGMPRITLTESLLNNWSPEAAAAYIVREMSDLYYEGVPASAERGYLSYSNMVRSFAEMTNSDLNVYDKAWATDLDQDINGQYAIQNYYGNWRQAVEEAMASWSPVPIQNSEFMNFIRTGDDSNVEPDAKLTLYQRWQYGQISYETYREMTDYVNSIVQSEWDWINDSGRR